MAEPPRPTPRLIAVAAFDPDEEGELQSVPGYPMEMQSEDRAERAARTAFLAGTAIALLAILVGAAFAQPDSSTDIGAAKANWAAMTDRCWDEVDDEGHPISETEMKVACITAGVLTAQLVNAGYCLDAKANEWRPCTASRRGR